MQYAMRHKTARAYGRNTSVRANFMHHVVPKLRKKDKIWKRKGDKTVVPTSRYDLKSGSRNTY